MSHCSLDSLPDAARISASDLFRKAYTNLKDLAHRELGRRPSPTLDTTGLIHELYLKLCAGRDLAFQQTENFFAYSAVAMRHILIDRANRRMCAKCGFGVPHTELDDAAADSVAINPLLALQLDAALNALEAEDRRAAKVVELHFFAGLSLERVADLLGVVRRTVDRDWRYARAFLLACIA